MVTVNAVSGIPFAIGKRGEHGVTRVAFNLKPFLADCGEGAPFLTAVRPGEDVSYAAVVTREEDTAYWEIGAEWTALCGIGTCQLSWLAEGKTAKSKLYSFFVEDSLDGGDEIPPAGMQYLDALQQCAVRAESAAQQVEARLGDVGNIDEALDALHAYAQTLMGGVEA